MFQDLSNYLGEYNVITTNRTDGQSNENKTQVVINLGFALNKNDSEKTVLTRKMTVSISL